MREGLVVRLETVKRAIMDANNAVFVAYCELQTAKDALQVREDELFNSGSIDGKNAETRAVQLRQQTIIERQDLAEAEREFEAAKIALKNRQFELQIALALVELSKGVA